MMKPILLDPDLLAAPDLAHYRRLGGYEGLKRALGLKPEEVVEEVSKAHLRGRGGSGFPTAVKWELVQQNREPIKFLVCNANEDEPGTFKDRVLLTKTPHQLLEGVIIAAYAVGAQTAYLYINGRFEEEIRSVERAVAEARGEGFIGPQILGSTFDLHAEIVRSPGVYIAGEETACLEVIEGKNPIPRQKPPYYPATHGLWGKPTLVNNVETLCNVPHILRRGSAWYAGIGPRENHGTRIFCLSGDIERPGLYELPMGTPLRTLIERYGGGVKNGGRLKAVFPGGPSFGVLKEDRIDTPMDFDAMKSAGSGLGTGGMIVVGERTCLVEKVLEFARFFQQGSCGQCPPCKLGTLSLAEILERIETGSGQPADLDLALQIGRMITRKGICHLVTAAVQSVESALRQFRSEFEAHLQTRACPFRPAG